MAHEERHQDVMSYLDEISGERNAIALKLPNSQQDWHDMMHLSRELCGGRICVSPDHAAFVDPDTRPWLDKFYSVNENRVADDRRKLLALAGDLLNSDNASHKLTFALFAQSPPFAHLHAVYDIFDFDGSLEFVKHAAGSSDRVMGEQKKEKAA